MSALDQINANGQDYDIMSPEVVSDYVEKIGTICKNPNGYTKGSLFLARDAQNVERMYKATSAIASNQTITSGTNCTVKKLGDLFNDVDSDVSQVKQALSDEVVTRATLGAHNLISRGFVGATHNGIVFTANSDGSVSAVGTIESSKTVAYKDSYVFVLKAGSYILSKNPIPAASPNKRTVVKLISNNNTVASAETTEEVKFTINEDKECFIRLYCYNENTQYNVTFYPMIRLASDSDTTYQPYAKPNTELTRDDAGLTANAFENGCVNKLPNYLTSQVTGGATVVVNDDKTISIHTSGIALAANVDLRVLNTTNPEVKLKGKYKLIGCPTGGISGNTTNYLMMAQIDGAWQSAYDSGSGVNINVSSVVQIVMIRLYAGLNIPSNAPLVFKPMITLADQPNSDYAHYVPYAMTNRELTEKNNYASLITAAHENINYLPYSSVAIKSGNIVYMNLTYTLQGAIPSYTKIFDVPSALRNNRNSDERIPMVVQIGSNQAVYNPYNGGIYTSGNSWPDSSETYHMACTFVI